MQGPTTKIAARVASSPRVSASMRPVASDKDILSLARDHPAWRLADALERRRFAPGDTTSTRSYPTAFDTAALTNSFASTDFADLRSLKKGADLFSAPNLDGARPRDNEEAAFGVLDAWGRVSPGLDFALPRRRQAARLSGWEQAARAQQETAFADFLQGAAQQQFALRRARENDLGAALADNVEAARQVRFAPGDPLLPPDPVQLEMTNLRLRLLKNAQLTLLEKQRARARLAILEARWRQNLQNGQAANRNEFLEQRDAMPLRVRNEGEARIVAALAQMRAEDSARRGATQAALSQRLAADFNAQDATLDILLPAVSPPVFRYDVMEANETRKTSVKMRNGSGKTFLPASSSNSRKSNTRTISRAMNFPTRLPPFGSGHDAMQVAVINPNRNSIDAQIRALRKRALWESAQWARLTARSSKSR